MLIDLRQVPDEGPISAETIIVGSGAVGLTLAVELARAGRDVIVLEAGDRGVQAESQRFFDAARWREWRLPGLHLGRYRALGGTTNFWGGQLLPFDPIVFEARPWVAESAWPITREALDPYYERGYALLGMAQHLPDEMVWARLKVAPPPLGDELESVFSAWVPHSNLTRLFRSDIEAGANLRVFVNAPVVALDLDRDGERIAGVVVGAVGGAARRFSAQRVILANGTIEIARLMKLTLADGRPAPWSANHWLGKGFIDHLDCHAGHVTPLDKRRFHDLFENAYLDGIKYSPKLKLSARAQKERKLLGVAAFFLFDSRLQEHLENAKVLVRSLFRGRLQGQTVPNPRELVSALRVALPMIVRYLRYHRVYNPADQGAQLRLMSEQLPHPESALHLDRKCDELGMPIVEIDWRIDGREIETLATISERVVEFLERNQLARVRLDPALRDRDPSLLKRLNDYYHHMGMARMAKRAADGVVDADLRVFGTRNLYVAGAAVYPTSGFANPTFTAIALGLRLADMIATGRASA
jgi:choline dehydrogenase-like flavoprotein